MFLRQNLSTICCPNRWFQKWKALQMLLKFFLVYVMLLPRKQNFGLESSTFVQKQCSYRSKFESWSNITVTILALKVFQLFVEIAEKTIGGSTNECGLFSFVQQLFQSYMSVLVFVKYTLKSSKMIWIIESTYRCRTQVFLVL